MDILRVRKDDLIEQAEKSGVKVDPDWTKRQIADAIDYAVKSKPGVDETQTVRESKPSGIRNVSGQRWLVYSQELAPGDIYTPTDKDFADKRGTAKVDRAVAMGKLEHN